MTIVKQRDTELVLRAARLYYEDKKSQDEVAKVLGTSRSNVSRMLTLAKELGLVEIRVVAPISRHEALSNQIQHILGIKEVQVIATELNDLVLTAVGRAAARSVIHSLRPNQTIAISWGRGLEATVHGLENENISGLKVTQLMGSLSSIATSVSAEEVGRTLARNLNAQFVPFLAPVVVSTAKMRNSLIQEQSIASTLELARRADIAIVGVGSKGSSSSEKVLEEFKLPRAEAEQVRNKYAGDIATHFYDIEGNVVSPAMDRRVIGLTLEEIRNIPKVVGIAAGYEKAEGVIGAAKAGLIDVLIIDLACANAIVKLISPKMVKSA